MTVFLTRVALHNYKSIAACDVRLGALTYLLGPSGAGKSNFIDALQLVAEACGGDLAGAVARRGGMAALLHRSAAGSAAYLGVRLEFTLDDGLRGACAFSLRADAQGGARVEREECTLDHAGGQHRCEFADGRVSASSGPVRVGATLRDTALGLIGIAPFSAFGEVAAALAAMRAYRLDPEALRQASAHGPADRLRSRGDNLAAVLMACEARDREKWQLIQACLHAMVPTVRLLGGRSLGPVDTLVFEQGGAQFHADSMSDSTMHALGMLAALFDGARPSLLCLEQPEGALHHAAATIMRDAVARASTVTQVIATSGSDSLLGNGMSSPPVDVLCATAIDGATELVPLPTVPSHQLWARLRSGGALAALQGKPAQSGPPPPLWTVAAPQGRRGQAPATPPLSQGSI